MEVVEESVQSAIENVKPQSLNDGETELLIDTGVCHTSNGVTVTTTPLQSSATLQEYPVINTQCEQIILTDKSALEPQQENLLALNVVDIPVESSIPPANEVLIGMKIPPTDETVLDNAKSKELVQHCVDDSEAILCNEVVVQGTIDSVQNADSSNDKVTIRTEILVEKSDDDDVPTPYEVPVSEEVVINIEDQNNEHILNEIDQSIEMSEALRSSDTTDNVENNNIVEGEEVFNNEELLDILEGNDAMATGDVSQDLDTPNLVKMLEAQIAMKQLRKLKKTKRGVGKSKQKKLGRKGKQLENSNSKKDINILEKSGNETEKDIPEKENTIDKQNIVNVLVKDWDDDEPLDINPPNKSLEESQSLSETTENIEIEKKCTVSVNADSTKNSVETESAEISGQNTKGVDESQPQRRLGRVIKKKVIFDPDNPDTFTKGKSVLKNKETLDEKEQPPTKKSKSEQTPQRSKSKSPTSKLQWKKPTPKINSKQYKRLSEVDKLLMDEGAVNMIYQLTPEALKGKKNMRTKAEFIKKIQSSTPDSNEMKFRERKKEYKSEEGEARKILGGKSRSSLSSSVKSPSVSEDFENHSADDSIIYRRHSSSSYSSTCMSPRRLSDVESGAGTSAPRSIAIAQAAATTTANITSEPSDVFMEEPVTPSSPIINKNDCLSMKEKLNSKLSLALNKKKKDSPKPQKPAKQKRTSKISPEDVNLNLKSETVDSFNYIVITIELKLAELCVKKAEIENRIQVLKELHRALLLVNSIQDTSVTLITSECGTLCSDLLTQALVGINMEAQVNYAYELAEAIRCLLCTMWSHSKMLVTCAWGPCGSVAAALMAVADVAVAGEEVTFQLRDPPLPAAAALLASPNKLSHALIRELVVVGRAVGAAEAARGGLVARVAPADALHVARALAKNIAAEPMQSVILKKKLMKLTSTHEAEATFLSCLEKERDLLIAYWMSVDGQEAIRTSLVS